MKTKRKTKRRGGSAKAEGDKNGVDWITKLKIPRERRTPRVVVGIVDGKRQEQEAAAVVQTEHHHAHGGQEEGEGGSDHDHHSSRTSRYGKVYLRKKLRVQTQETDAETHAKTHSHGGDSSRYGKVYIRKNFRVQDLAQTQETGGDETHAGENFAEKQSGLHKLTHGDSDRHASRKRFGIVYLRKKLRVHNLVQTQEIGGGTHTLEVETQRKGNSSIFDEVKELAEEGFGFHKVLQGLKTMAQEYQTTINKLRVELEQANDRIRVLEQHMNEHQQQTTEQQDGMSDYREILPPSE